MVTTLDLNNLVMKLINGKRQSKQASQGNHHWNEHQVHYSFSVNRSEKDQEGN